MHTSFQRSKLALEYLSIVPIGFVGLPSCDGGLDVGTLTAPHLLSLYLDHGHARLDFVVGDGTHRVVDDDWAQVRHADRDARKARLGDKFRRDDCCGCHAKPLECDCITDAAGATRSAVTDCGKCDI